MSLPAAARHRWGIDEGGALGFVDLGDCVLLVPGGIEALRRDLLDRVSPDQWVEAQRGFGDPDLATE